MHATHIGVRYILLETDSTCIIWVDLAQVGNGKNRKEVERNFSTYIQRNKSISKLALICIYLLYRVVLYLLCLTKFKTLFAVWVAICMHLWSLSPIHSCYMHKGTLSSSVFCMGQKQRRRKGETEWMKGKK